MMNAWIDVLSFMLYYSMTNKIDDANTKQWFIRAIQRFYTSNGKLVVKIVRNMQLTLDIFSEPYFWLEWPYYGSCMIQQLIYNQQHYKIQASFWILPTNQHNQSQEMQTTAIDVHIIVVSMRNFAPIEIHLMSWVNKLQLMTCFWHLSSYCNELFIFCLYSKWMKKVLNE